MTTSSLAAKGCFGPDQSPDAIHDVGTALETV